MSSLLHAYLEEDQLSSRITTHTTVNPGFVRIHGGTAILGNHNIPFASHPLTPQQVANSNIAINYNGNDTNEWKKYLLPGAAAALLLFVLIKK